MRVEGTSISCGVNRLIITNDEKPSKQQLSTLISENKNRFAILVTAVPARRKDVTTLLLEHDFERVKNPAQVQQDNTWIFAESVKSDFADIGSLLMYHDGLDDSVRYSQFVGATINANLTDMAAIIMHHGNEFVGNLDLFIRYMQ